MTAMIIQDSERATLAALAKDLGREASALSRAAGKIRQRMREDEGLRQKHEEILNSMQAKKS